MINQNNCIIYNNKSKISSLKAMKYLDISHWDVEEGEKAA